MDFRIVAIEFHAAYLDMLAGVTVPISLGVEDGVVVRDTQLNFGAARQRHVVRIIVVKGNAGGAHLAERIWPEERSLNASRNSGLNSAAAANSRRLYSDIRRVLNSRNAARELRIRRGGLAVSLSMSRTSQPRRRSA